MPLLVQSILVAGDSILGGMAESLWKLLRRLPVRGDFVWSDGASVKTYLEDAALMPMLTEKKHTLAVIMLGTNPDPGDSPGESMTPERHRDMAIAIVNAVRKRSGCPVIWVGPWVAGGGYKARLDALRGLRGVCVVDPTRWTAGLARTSDGVHFPREAYPVLSARLVAALRPLISPRAPGWISDCAGLLFAGATGAAWIV